MASRRNKFLGLLFLIGPFAGLILTLVAYAVVAFVIANVEPGVASQGGLPIEAGVMEPEPELRVVVGSIINMILGLLGLICVVGIIVGIPLGIIFLTKKELPQGTAYDERSGSATEKLPDEIKGWNWGAFGLMWIWGLYYGVWISLLTAVPVVGLIIWVLLGIKGNEWAWRASKWESTEKFLS